MNRVVKFVSTFALFFAFGLCAFAQDAKKPADKPADKPAAKPVDAKPTDPKAADPKAAPKPGDKGAAAGQMSAEEAEMMARFMAYATPGPEHALLKPLAGNFSCDIKMTMEPGAPPQMSSGTVKREWILGDRYIREEVESTFMDMSFQGRGIVGYDNGNKKYFFAWIDSMGTGLMTSTGTAKGKVVTFEGENYDPSAGKMVWGKSVMDLSNNDKHVFKMYTKDKSGKEFENFDMTCTRK